MNPVPPVITTLSVGKSSMIGEFTIGIPSLDRIDPITPASFYRETTKKRSYYEKGSY